MYQGKSAVAARSQRWIANALVELMEDMPFRQITVKDICEKSGLSRQTFYNLFDSKEQVLRFRLHTNYMKLYRHFTSETLTMDAIVAACVQALENEKDFLKLLAKNEMEGLFTEEVSRNLEQLYRMYIGRTDDPIVISYGVVFISGALSRAVFHWATADDGLSAADFALVIRKVIHDYLLERERNDALTVSKEEADGGQVG